MSFLPKFNFSKRQWMTLAIIGLADFCNAICVSLQAPFFPNEAEKKGCTATEYGLVFGIFELIVFLISPVYGQYLNALGPKVLFNGGIFTTGIAAILFGLLDRIPDHYWFISLAFIIRIVEALGNAAFLTASFAIIAREFPNNIGTTFASLETCFGLGLIVGPTVGGSLYALGGYFLPFVVLGFLLFFTALVTVCILPRHHNEAPSESNGPSMRSVLRIPGVLVCSLAICATSASIGFLSATLEPHVRQFDLSPVLLGMIFVINGGVYALSAPIWGWMVDRFMNPKVASFMGTLFVIAGFCSVGPAPFIPMETKLSNVILGLVLHGVGIAALLVSCFSDALRTAIRKGLADSIETYGLISGLWTSTFALGAFVGPSVSGALYDSVGFRAATLFIVGLHAIVGLILVIFLLSERKPKVYKELSPKEPLLKTRPYDSDSSSNVNKNGMFYTNGSTTANGNYECQKSLTSVINRDWRKTCESGSPISMGMRPYYGSVDCIRSGLAGCPEFVA